MSYEDNPADERYQLDQCIDEIKLLRDQLAKSDAALAAAAEQLRAVMEANEILRKQLSDQARELGVLEGKAEMWQQRAEIAEAALTQRRPTVSDADWIEEALAEYKYDVHDDLRRDIVIDLRQAYAAHIAACDTTNLAERIADVACDYAQDFPKHGGAEFQTHVAKLLAPLLARNAAMEAVLRECREHIQHIDIGYLQPIITDLLSRIDKLTAKGAGQ